jgi:hypothetical protein
MTQRPLLCISKSGIRRLANKETVHESINESVLEQFQVVTDLESELFAILPHDSSMISRFSNSLLVMDNLQRLTENPLSAQLYFDRDVLPSTEEDFKSLKDDCPEDPEIRQVVDEWCESYRHELKKLCARVVELANYQAQLDNSDLNGILSTCPGLDPQRPLSYNSIKAARSMHSGCTLVGMTREEHVKEVLSIEDKVNYDILDNIISSPYFE